MWPPVPIALGVYDALHEEEAPEPDRVQGEFVKLPPEPALEVKVTVPLGVTGVVEVSITVAVHDVEEPTTTEEGRQLTEVDTGRVPYVPLTSGIPAMGSPKASKRAF
jgi:hypothetical protein